MGVPLRPLPDHLLSLLQDEAAPSLYRLPMPAPRPRNSRDDLLASARALASSDPFDVVGRRRSNEAWDAFVPGSGTGMEPPDRPAAPGHDLTLVPGPAGLEHWACRTCGIVPHDSTDPDDPLDWETCGTWIVREVMGL